MATSWKLLKGARGGGRLAMSFLLALLVGWCSVAQLLARTPTGVHCPTASVQTVTVPDKVCCGRVVAVVTRKPKLGEKGFLQCRCAEKRSNQQQADLDQNGPHFDMLPPSILVIHVPIRVQEAPMEHPIDARLTAVPSAPPVPPPSLA